MTQTIGSRRQVWNGTCKKTSGGLTKNDLMMSHGRIVSKSKHFSAKKEMRLLKHGYGTKKGKFGFVKTKKHRKMRGGHVNIGSSMFAANVDGQGITNYGSGSNDVQIAAGMAGGRRRNRSMAGGRKRHRRMAGGSGMRSMSDAGSANWNGEGLAGAGITVGNAGSANLQLLAGMAGGRKRRHRKSMRGGTTKPFPPQSIGSPINMALGAS